MFSVYNSLSVWGILTCMKNKASLSRYLPSVLIALLLFLLCSRFSYFADDWFWGTDGRFSTFIDSFTNPENPFHFYNNGRYFGNGLGFLAANHRLFRDLVMTAVLFTIITFIIKISLLTAETDSAFSASKRNFLLFLTGAVLLLFPKEMFRESIGWSVAFMIYVVPSALYLISLHKLYSRKEDQKTDLLFFLLPVLSAFFIENLTIGNAIFIVVWIGYRLLRKRKPSVNEWLYLAGSVIGLALMFADDGYRQILQGNAEETYWGAQTGSLWKMIETGFSAFRNFIASAIVGWMLFPTCFGAVSFLLAYVMKKDSADRKSQTALLCLTVMDILIAVFFLLRKIIFPGNIFSPVMMTVSAVLAVLFLLSLPCMILLLPYSESQRERFIFTWLFAAFVTLPLLVAEPLSMRVFFPTSVFLLLLYFQITAMNLKEINKHLPGITDRKLFACAAVLFLIAWGYRFGIYFVIDHYEKERIKYVRYQESLGNYDTVFPTLPLPDHVIVSYPWENTWQERYKKFFGLNLDMNFTIVSFEEWKEHL